MAKLALLIGCPFGGLSGVENDLASMEALLNAREFTLSRCYGEAATRAGILDAWQRITDAASDRDAVVVYFSGHGGLAVDVDGKGSSRTTAEHPTRYQFIVPMDFGKSTDGDFKGITNVELSRLLHELTTKTQNVTHILDCCHAARMSRDLDLTPKALPRAHYTGVASHVQRLRREGLLDGPPLVEGNPNAVRIVASALSESAYEYTNSHGHRVGVLTEALRLALEAAGDCSISWRTVLLHVRERVRSIVPQQNPDIEGPISRTVFGTDSVGYLGTLGIASDKGRFIISGGRIAGVEEGDVYAVMPYGAERVDPSVQIAEATVQRVRGATANVGIRFLRSETLIPEGALAFPVFKALRRWAVRVQGKEPAASDFRSRLVQSRFLRGVDEDGEDVPLATVRLIDGQVELTDRGGLLLVRPRAADQAALADAMVNLDNLARAQHLLGLRGGFGRHELAAPIAVEWGRVEAGAKVPLASSGETILTGERVYFTIGNPGSFAIYATVFDVGINGKVTVLSLLPREVLRYQGG